MSEAKDLSKQIREFAKARDWEQFLDPKNLALSLSLEATEVLELFQWTQDNDLKKGKEAELAEELADVYYWLLYIADKFNIDINEALRHKMTVNELKYPVEKAKGNSKKYTELS